MRHRLSRRLAPPAAMAVGAASVIAFAFVGFIVIATPAAAAPVSSSQPTGVLLARIGTAEISAIVGGVIFMAIIGFFLFWGGPPRGGGR